MVRLFAIVWFSFAAVFAQFYKGKPPTTTKPVKTFNYTYYAVGYSDETRTPLWSAMEVKNAGEPTLGCKRVSKFASEPQADPEITHKDYANDEGYSRGHMTPNAIMAYVYGCEAAKTNRCVRSAANRSGNSGESTITSFVYRSTTANFGFITRAR